MMLFMLLCRHRALTEGRDLNLFFRYGNPALQGRAASFCMERSGYNEGFANDQGLSFFLPNMTWLQPPGYVHAMIHESWQPLAVNFSLSPGCAASGINVSAGDISAAANADGSAASVRIVNQGSEALQIAVVMAAQRTDASPSSSDESTTGRDRSEAAVDVVEATALVSVLKGSACASNDTFPYVSEHTACANTPAQPELFSPTPWAAPPLAPEAARAGAGVGAGVGKVTVPGFSYAIVKLQTTTN